MHHSSWVETALDYRLCRYGQSRLLYRGPKKSLRQDYAAFLGDSLTFGRFVATPYPDLVDIDLGVTCVNLACRNAGVDAILNDEHLLTICKKSKVTVLQIMGAANLSNRFYTVHPRRNDRFIQASPLAERVFAGLDFTEFNFTHHLLAQMKAHSAKGYDHVVRHLQETWIARMRQLIRTLDGNVILLLIGTTPLEEQWDHQEPVFVTRRMLNAVKSRALGCVEVPITQAARAQGTDGMYFLPHEAAAAAQMPGPQVHADAAEVLAPVIKAYLNG